MMTILSITNYLKSLIRDERGQGMVEYGLILALIAIVVIGAVTGIGNQLLAKFNEILTNLGGSTS